MSKTREKAVLGIGCFWCTEAVFRELKGVEKIEVGYAGGTLENPSYRDVIYKDTGHAEVARITFDPEIIAYESLLDVFWTVHDPTSLNKQGADVGPQYRSVIFYYDEEQKEKAVKSRDEAQKELYKDEIVTDIEPLGDNFYKAEENHQEYYKLNPNAGYCRVVIDPKVKKFRKRFEKYLKD